MYSSTWNGTGPNFFIERALWRLIWYLFCFFEFTCIVTAPPSHGQSASFFCFYSHILQHWFEPIHQMYWTVTDSWKTITSCHMMEICFWIQIWWHKCGHLQGSNHSTPNSEDVCQFNLYFGSDWQNLTPLTCWLKFYGKIYQNNTWRRTNIWWIKSTMAFKGLMFSLTTRHFSIISYFCLFQNESWLL